MDEHLDQPQRLGAREAGRTIVIAGAFTLGCLASLTLTACGDDAPQRGATERSGAGEASGHKVPWLELSSSISPAQWLASRDAPKPKPHHDPEVQRLVAVLASAHTRYRESERMIANRSVQLSEMLKPFGIDESATDILNDLAVLGGDKSQTEGFGAVSQYYFNLRAAGVARADALATLKARYGSNS